MAATIKKRGSRIVAVTGASHHFAHGGCGAGLQSSRERLSAESGSTASTTAALALGDALAVSLMIRRGFSRTGFLKHHPARQSGERLNLKVKTSCWIGPTTRSDENARSRNFVQYSRAKNFGLLGDLPGRSWAL